MRTPRLILMAIALSGLFLGLAACGEEGECVDTDGDDDCGNDGDENTTSGATSGTTALNHEAGDTCGSVADCAPGLDICNDDPGGQCTKDCSAPADCAAAAGSICESERPGHCYKECSSKADCPRDGYDCVGGPNQEGKMWCDVVE